MTKNAEDDNEPSIWLLVFIGFASLGLLVWVVSCRDKKATPGQEPTTNQPTAEPITSANAVPVEEGDIMAHPLPPPPPPNPPHAEPIARAVALLVEEGDIVAHPLPSAPLDIVD